MSMTQYAGSANDEEQQLWENDSSYLVAVSPKLFENNRIRLKIIIGSRVRAQVHALPGPPRTPDYDLPMTEAEADNGAIDPRLRRYRGETPAPSDVVSWALQNIDQFGWKGLVALFALGAGLYTAVIRPRTRNSRFWMPWQ
uniref:Gsp-co-occurring protein 5 n=1 Tax=Malawimonas jakobiformis TaxID=136089 RepID=A0A895KRT8_MALJA|nr:Gsp-co-occurring protein 5 [Malawimonas jakobiformis]